MGREVRKGRTSFLKKRSKKLLSVWARLLGNVIGGHAKAMPDNVGNSCATCGAGTK
jgi:hypothetical protein